MGSITGANRREKTMPRSDISEYLVHFTRDETEEDAFLRLEKILNEGLLYGSNRLIRGGYN